MMEGLPEVIDARQAQAILECSRTTLWRLIRDNRLIPIPQDTYSHKPPLRFHTADVIKLWEEGWYRRYYY